MTIRLNAIEAARNADKAFKGGRLGFQNDETTCVFRYPDSDTVCALGASFSDDDMKLLETKGKPMDLAPKFLSIRALCDNKIVISDNPPFLQELQNLHDNIVAQAYAQDWETGFPLLCKQHGINIETKPESRP